MNNSPDHQTHAPSRISKILSSLSNLLTRISIRRSRRLLPKDRPLPYPRDLDLLLLGFHLSGTRSGGRKIFIRHQFPLQEHPKPWS